MASSSSSSSSSSSDAIDSFLKKLGNPGRYQCLVCLLIILSDFPIAFQHLNMVFLGAIPQHHCKVPANETMNDTIPNIVKDGQFIYDQCHVYADPANHSEGIIPCPDGWTYLYEDNEWTIVGEWDLVCHRNWLIGLVTTVYFGGTLLASPLLGSLSDTYGRKPIFLGGLYGGVTVGICQYFSTSYLSFILLKFLHGIMIEGVNNTATSLNMELFRTKHRTEASIARSAMWTSVQFALVLFAYLTPNWRNLYLLTSIPSIVTLSYIWLVPESLRWLLVNGKIAGATKVAQRYSAVNKVHILPSNIEKEITNLVQTNGQSGFGGTNKKYDLRDLFRTKYIRRTTLLTVYMWFAVSVVYYGINYSLPSLGGNKYVNFAISAGVELAGRLLLYPAFKLIGRRLPSAFAFLSSGVLCIAFVVIDFATGDSTNLKWIAIGCALVGKATCSMAYACVVLVTNELFPTVIRGVAFGFCGLANRIGGMSAPQILLLGDYSPVFIPLLCFGTLAIFAGMATLATPETRNVTLPNTIEDAETLCSKRKKSLRNQRLSISVIDATVARQPSITSAVVKPNKYETLEDGKDNDGFTKDEV